MIPLLLPALFASARGQGLACFTVPATSWVAPSCNDDGLETLRQKIQDKCGRFMRTVAADSLSFGETQMGAIKICMTDLRFIAVLQASDCVRTTGKIQECRTNNGQSWQVKEGDWGGRTENGPQKATTQLLGPDCGKENAQAAVKKLREKCGAYVKKIESLDQFASLRGERKENTPTSASIGVEFGNLSPINLLKAADCFEIEQPFDYPCKPDADVSWSLGQ